MVLLPIGSGVQALALAETANQSGAVPLPDTGVSVLRVLVVILVLAIFFGGVWLFKNSQRALGRPRVAASFTFWR